MHIPAMTALKQWMEENRKTDADVAAAVGSVSRSQVNRLKNGVSKPSFDSAAALEELTGIPAGQLFRAANEGGAP